MNSFYQSVPRDTKSPNVIVRFAVDGISLSFFRKQYRKMNAGALGLYIP